MTKPDNNSVQEFLAQHRLQWGSRLEFTLHTGQTVRGQLVPPPDHSTSLHLRYPDGYQFGIALEMIQSIRETGFSPWPPPEPLSSISTSTRPHSRSSASQAHGASYPEPWPGPTRLTQLQPEVLVLLPQLSGSDNPYTDGFMDRLRASDHTLPTPLQHHLRWERISPPGDEVSPEQLWKLLLQHIWQGLEQGLSGIVVAHPRTTLLHTAIALTWMLQDLPIPVLFVGVGNAERWDWRKDSVDIQAACIAAVTADSAELLLCVPEDATQQRHRLLRVTQSLLTHSTHRSGFTSPGQPPVGVLTGDTFRLCRHDSPPRLWAREPKKRWGWSSQVYSLCPTPTTSSGLGQLLTQSRPQGVVLGLPDVAQIPQAWSEVVGHLLYTQIPVYVVSTATTGPADLLACTQGRRWRHKGLRSLPPILLDTAHSKLCWAVTQANTPEAIDALMQMPIAGEFQEEDSVILKAEP